MGNEMGNNNTSGFREEENTKDEAPEVSLLQGGGGDVKPDEVEEFHRKETRLGSDDADRVTRDHRVTEMIANDEEEEKNDACNQAEFQVISEKSTDKTKEDSEIQTASKEVETMELNLKESRLDTYRHEHERQASKSKEEEREKGSNLNTIILASDDPGLERIPDFECVQLELQETKTEQLVEESNKSPQECKDALGLSSKHTNHQVNDDNTNHQASDDPVDSERIAYENQGTDTDRDMDKEKGGERGTGSHLNTIVLTSDDPKSDKILDLGCIQHEFPEAKVEPSVESNDEYSREREYASRSGLKHTDGENGHLTDTAKSTNMDQGIDAETGADVERKEDGLIEPKSCHEYIMAAAKKTDTEDGEAITDLIAYNSSGSQPEDGLKILPSKAPMQVPAVEEKCTILTEETKLKEEASGNGTIIQDNIPTQFCMLSRRFRGEYDTVELGTEINAKEIMVFPDSVGKNMNRIEAPNNSPDGEIPDIDERGVAILNLSIRGSEHETEEMGEKTEISIDDRHEAESRKSEESLSQVHLQETSLSFQIVESTDKSISTLKQETEPEIEKSKKNISATSTESNLLTIPIDEQSARKFRTPTFNKDQESQGRTSNGSNSDNSISNHEMRKSPSFNIDIQSEGKGEDSLKIPLLYQMKTMEDLSNLQEISFPNPMEKRVITLGRSVSDKLKTSFLGFDKEKEEPQIEITKLDQDKSAPEKAVPIPIRKGKRRTKSSIFGNCICCATAIT